jgi:hypothetical protein
VGFTTVPEALRAAGKAAGDAVGALRGADCGTPVVEVAAALPGSKAAAAATSIAESWKATFSAWCTDAGQQANALTAAADTYGTGDHAAKSSLPDDGKMTGPR